MYIPPGFHKTANFTKFETKAERRSAANPGKVIYLWLSGCEFWGEYYERLTVSNEEEMERNNVSDSEIVGVYRDGERMD